MQSMEQDVLFRDILLAFAALIGLLYVLIINIKESRVRFRNFNSLLSSHSQFDPSKTDWHGDFVKNYPLHFDEPHVIWEINMFSMRMMKKDKAFSSFAGFPWFEFSKSQSTTEKIMSPILRKIFLKYRSKFEKVQPIHVVRVPKESVHFYTWLQNETHTHTAVFNFLDEALIIASEAKIYPTLSIVWDDVIFVEVIFPNNTALTNIEHEFDKSFGIDCTVTKTHVNLKLWIAFSIEKIPTSLKDKEKKIHSFGVITKAS
ncbi:hypothetical protein [Silvanigrella aquatica]|uniref:Uncharacterized protein n=1 Tax=Silvanigrella aquatica TaxID=1915309 RepID=A0A1L4CYQ3_9BACT|nr:hypothetical protein [Silvanigrella aquatica]APJ03078.1 hypothetical protein AXG55_03795 [Silvanigrella aquatica]